MRKALGPILSSPLTGSILLLKQEPDRASGTCRSDQSLFPQTETTYYGLFFAGTENGNQDDDRSFVVLPPFSAAKAEPGLSWIKYLQAQIGAVGESRVKLVLLPSSFKSCPPAHGGGPRHVNPVFRARSSLRFYSIPRRARLIESIPISPAFFLIASTWNCHHHSASANPSPSRPVSSLIAGSSLVKSKSRT